MLWRVLVQKKKQKNRKNENYKGTDSAKMYEIKKKRKLDRRKKIKSTIWEKSKKTTIAAYFTEFIIIYCLPNE